MTTVYVKLWVADENLASVKDDLAKGKYGTDHLTVLAGEALVQEGRNLVGQDYADDVQCLAEEFASNWKWTAGNPDQFSDRESALEWLHETIDGSQRVIYTYQAQLGLACSNNDGAYIEEFGAEGAVSNGDLNWSALMFAALERDVLEYLELIDIDTNAEPQSATDECDNCSHERQEHNGEAGPKGSAGHCTQEEPEDEGGECDCDSFEEEES